MQLTHHEFREQDLVGGDLTLDFVNTVTARDTTPSDWLDDFGALLRWAARTGSFRSDALAALTRRAEDDPASAAAALEKAKRLREALNLASHALARGQAPDVDILSTIHAIWHEAAASASLAPRDRRLSPRWTIERSGLDLVAHVVAARAIMLFDQELIERLKLCDGTDCGWYFLDVSKNGRRRWCDMATCGNLAKARRHQQRHRHKHAAR